MTIDLADGTSFTISSVSHGLYPKRFVQIGMVVTQTPGEIAVDPDTIEMFGVHYQLYYSAADPAKKAICLALLGKNLGFIRQWILDQWPLFRTDPDSCDDTLKPIFEYVERIGIAQ